MFLKKDKGQGMNKKGTLEQNTYMVEKQAIPKRLTDKEMRQLLTNLKKEADKSPEEKGSFSLEVICSGKDMESKK